MTKLGASLLAAGIMVAGMHAYADDMHKNHPNREQRMKDCMSRMTAKNDGSTKEQMQTACDAEMKKGMGMGKEGMDMGKDAMGGGKDNTDPAQK
jgi:hypothetical protein